MLTCQHAHTSFIKSQSAAGQNSERYTVRCCTDCGLLMVKGSKEGVHFEVNFHIGSQDTIDTLRAWANYVQCLGSRNV